MGRKRARPFARSRPARPLSFFTSGYTEAHGVGGILPADAPHLQKPYEARELLRTVRLAIETRRT